MTKYLDQFSDWADVKQEFGIDMAEPDEVIAACYETPPYEGYAFVCYRQGDRFFTVEGSHCSCYGLENQWEPEEYDAATLLASFERSDGWGARGACAQLIKSRLTEYLAASEA